MENTANSQMTIYNFYSMKFTCNALFAVTVSLRSWRLCSLAYFILYVYYIVADHLVEELIKAFKPGGRQTATNVEYQGT